MGIQNRDIKNIILSLKSDKSKIKVLELVADKLSRNDLDFIVLTLNDFSSLLFETEISQKLMKLFFLSGYLPLLSIGFNDITTGASENLYEELNKIVKTIETGKSISNFLTILSVQAKNDFEVERINNPNGFLPANIAEIIVSHIGPSNVEEIRNNGYLQSKEKELITIINESYNLKSILSLLEQMEQSKTEKLVQKIDQVLETLNIKKLKDKDGNIIDEELRGEYKNILEACSNPSIEELINNKDAETILHKIKMATRVIVEKSFENDEKRNKIGLLTKVCVFALNIQQKKWIGKQFEKLKEDAKNSLQLTEKGLEKIHRNRVLVILKEDEKLRRKLETKERFYKKINDIFEELYPFYVGKKNLRELYILMKEDEKYKNVLLQEILEDEKKELPLTKDYFKINEGLQRQRVLLSIINCINENVLPTVDDKGNLSSAITAKLNEIHLGIQSRNLSNDSKGIELLLNDSIELLNKETMGYLLIFYKKIYKLLDGVNFNAGNLNKYVEEVKKKVTISERKKTVLGEEVCNMLSSGLINSNYEHYMANMTKRFYRTIPNISGIVKSGDSEVCFRSYDVDDSKQLIVGARSKTVPSCFKIGGAQEETIKYITSSPNGTIIAIEDKKGNFIGRVYGYRIGNAVHFTQMFYNEPFDYKKVISQIAQDIIDKSKEIECVTVNPSTCLGQKYIDGELALIKYDDLKTTQEGTKIVIDNQCRPVIVAKRKSNVIFNREKPTEKFYKERKSDIKVIDLNIVTDEEIEKIVKTYIIAGGEDFVYLLNNMSQVVLGDGWCIFMSDNEKPIIRKISYGNEYIDGIINDEITAFLANTKDFRTTNFNEGRIL